MKKYYKKFIRAGVLTLFFGLSSSAYAQYCTPTYSSGCSLDDLNDVLLSGATVTLSNLNSGCNGAGYTDNTAMNAPDLAAGLTYTISVGTTYSSPSSESVRVWIDYNNNNVFDANEVVAEFNGLSAGLTSLPFTVPATATLGIKRMRVRLVYTSIASAIDPCSSETYGETEDYNVEIIAAPSCLPPSNLTVGNVVGTTLDLGWTENGTATQWQIEYGAHGFTPGTGTFQLTNSNPYSFTFTPGNDYDFYVRSICAPGDTSFWSMPYEYTYCGVSTSYGEYLTSVSSSGAVVDVSYSANSTPAGSYANETAQNFVGYETLTFNMNTNYSSGTNTVNVWVDWNNDMTFGTNELVATATNSTMHSLPITIPAGTPQGDYRMRVRGQWGSGALPPCGNVNYGSTVDFTLTIAATPTCLAPSNLTVSNVVGTTLDLGWTENNTATQWQIEYGAHGFTPGTGTFQLTNSNPYSFTFTPGNDYDFYVRSICAPGDTSYWSMAYEYTYCEVSTLYTGDHLSAVSSIGAETNVNYTTFSMPLGSYANETAQLFESYETQTFNMSTTYVGGGNGVNIWVDWNNDMVFDANELVGSLADNNATKNFTITVPVGTAQGDYRMRVRGQYGSTVSPPACGSVNYGSTVDFNLTIVAPPSCLMPTSFALSNVISTSAILSWVESGGATSWNIEYGPAGFALGSGTPVIANSNPFTLTGLTAQTSYSIYIQSNCGGGDLSDWAGPFALTTPCAATVAPWLYDVETAATTTNAQIGDCWSTTPTNTTSAFRWDVHGSGGTTPSSSTGPNSPYSGSKYFYTEASNGSTNDSAYLYTPQIDISALTVAELGFYYHKYGASMGDLLVQVSADYGTTWTTEINIIGEQQTAGGDPWREELILLNNYTGIIQVRFIGTKGSSFYGDMAIDNISIHEAPSCIKPNSLMASNITATSADLGWTEQGSATLWNIEYGIAGFTQGNGTIANGVTSNSYPITITPSTEYEFYVQSDCGGGDLSAWAGPFFFSNMYCTPVHTSGDYLSAVSSVGAQTNISYTASSQPTNGYANETTQIFEAYETQTFDILTTYVGGENGVKVWIDWNNDFVFDPITELVSYQIGSAASKTLTVTVPAGTNLGNYRVRVRGEYGSSANPGPCNTVSWGSTVDFTLTIVSPPMCLVPQGLSATNITTTSADLSWTDFASVSLWNIEFGTAGFTPGSGTLQNGLTTNSFNLPGLGINTDYEFYVQSDCGGTSQSVWSGPFAFTTLCAISNGTDVQVACDSYTWIDGVTYTASNSTATYTLVGGDVNGCDSIVTLDLTINYTATGTDLQTACNSFTWIDGVTYTASNNTATHTIAGGAANGCDSIVTLDLTIDPTHIVTGTDTQVACDSYTWIDGVTYTASNNTATHALIGGSVNGCDSIVTLDLTMNYAVTGTDTQVACDSYTWIDGVTYTASNNTATHTLVGGSVHGCDSTVTLNLTLSSILYGTDTQVACDSYTWIDGVTYTASNNTATHTLVGGSTNGCDSIVTLDLTINYAVTGTDFITACDSYTWIDGITYTASNNTATHTLVGGSVHGCDSTVTLDLTINNSSTGTDTQVACDSYTWIDGVTYTASNNTATHTLVNAAGCDSIVTLNLTINTTATGTFTHVACDSYTWINGVTYTASNNTATHTFVGGAANGCDSIVTLNLTIKNSVTSTDVRVACNSFLWINGVTYTSSNNTATHTIVGGAASGCDSIVSLNLTINNTVTGIDTQVACDSYTWINGVTYTTSNNTATHTLVGGSAHGCDSIVTLNLTINNSVTGTDVQVACDSYTWIDGVTYTASTNTASHTIVGGSVHGCDSTVTLNLTINNSVTGTDTQVACETFTWIDGVTYTSSNNTATYTIVGGSVHGCDSTVTLDLTIETANDAGDDNAVTVCINQPIDLDTLLSSGAQAGGVWLDPSGMPMASSIITSSSSNGVFEFSYKVASISCPESIAVITITVDDSCDYLKVDTESMVDISVYPNPATSILTILNPSNTSSLKVEMLDMNGRVVLVENRALNNATQATLAIDYLERGVYTLRVYNNKGQKTFKIVKH